ncbi:MAG: Trk system potassium transporter TrkA [Waddliaceae bacterium]|nr:Trk system potassium transporter TrkA [Waddliaceae bacterium]
MNILIIGAGQVGQYIAAMLSKEEHNVTLIDQDQSKLEMLGRHMDVATLCGDGTDWDLLDDCLDFNPELFLALTDNDETNLVACSVAKNLGYPKTVAKVRQDRYLNHTRLDFGRIFYVDHFISPELLLANDVFKHISNPGSIAVESFAHGAIQMRTIRIPSTWKSDKPLYQLRKKWPDEMMIGLIRRFYPSGEKGRKGRHDIIFPHGKDCLKAGDEVTCIGETDVIENLHQVFGLALKPARSAAIVGGSLIGLHLARILEEHGVSVSIIDKSYDRCCLLSQKLHRTTVIQHDAADLGFLKAEKLGDMDVFVTCTDTDEVNLVLAEFGREAGCENVVPVIFKERYQQAAERFGLEFTVSPQRSVADRILSIARASSVTSMASLYDGKAEILEIKISSDSKIVGIPVSELGPLLPKDLLLAVIQNRGRVIVVNGDRILSPGDTVIVISSPEHLDNLRKVF